MKNDKGSVLIWSLVLILIFSIFSVGILSISYTMSKRSIDTNTKKQLKLTASSAVEIVVQQIASTSDTSLKNAIVSSSDYVENNDFFSGDDRFGKCILRAKSSDDDNTIYVTATAISDDLIERYACVMVKTDSGFVAAKYSDNSEDYIGLKDAEGGVY